MTRAACMTFLFVTTAAGLGCGGAPLAGEATSQVSAEQLVWDFVDENGRAIDLREYRGKKKVLLVVMRGFNGMVCPMCTAQGASLIKNQDAIEKRNAVLLVVYPGPKERIRDFVASARAASAGQAPSFPVALDADAKIIAKLNIRGDLARPSTYIFDRQGELSFAYVGRSTADRPTIDAVLQQLDRTN